MNEPIENVYFNWLCAKVVRLENPTPSLTFWKLLRILHQTEFIWLVSGDDNRVEDGLELRNEFLLESNFEKDTYWFYSPCSVFEMLFAFSRRCEFATDQPRQLWFWLFLDNLGLKECNDASDPDEEYISQVLYNFVWRTYAFNGDGGLFPLRNPKHDQRDVEIWYQFSEYLIDQEQQT